MPSLIKIPKDLANELDRLAHAENRPRAAYAVEILWRDVQRSKQLEALQLSAGLWKTDQHPELAEGGAAHVERMRAERDERFEQIRRPKPPGSNRNRRSANR